jgi:hypothetical protein
VGSLFGVLKAVNPIGSEKCEIFNCFFEQSLLGQKLWTPNEEVPEAFACVGHQIRAEGSFVTSSIWGQFWAALTRKTRSSRRCQVTHLPTKKIGNPG